MLVTSNYELLKSKKDKDLYKKYYGLIFSDLAESQQGELLNNGFDVWLENGRDAEGCIIDFYCGLSVSGLALINNCEVQYEVKNGSKLYDSQIGILN